MTRLYDLGQVKPAHYCGHEYKNGFVAAYQPMWMDMIYNEPIPPRPSASKIGKRDGELQRTRGLKKRGTGRTGSRKAAIILPRNNFNGRFYFPIDFAICNL